MGVNLLDLYAKLTLDKSDYEEGIDDAEDEASGFGSRLAGKLGSVAKTAGKIGVSAVGATAVAIAGITKKAIDAYADYEQLTGGVETLFTKTTNNFDDFKDMIAGSTEDIKRFQEANNLVVDGIIGPQTMAALKAKYEDIGNISKSASDVVMKNANNAYLTAGMSVNEYMETVTSFSASLVQSLGGDVEKAANYADMAITDMADNSNKMGTSMESIQNAYNGFSKQNFTMLDNLKLGYGGTKEEMQRLLEDAEKFSGVKYDISSYADIVDAIHVVQQEMGITGTTALEASETISGSAASMKAAWTNVIIGLGDENADLAGLASNALESTVTFSENLLPRIGQVFEGLGEVIGPILEGIAEKAPQILENVVPDLLATAGTVLFNLGEYIVTNIPSFIQTIIEGFSSLFGSLADAAEESGHERLASIFQGISDLLNGEFFRGAWETIGGIVKSVFDGILGVITSVGSAIGNVVGAVIGAGKVIVDTLGGVFETAGDVAEQAAQNVAFYGTGELDPALVMLYQEALMDASESAKETAEETEVITEGLDEVGTTAEETGELTAEALGLVSEALSGNATDALTEFQSVFDAVAIAVQEGAEETYTMIYNALSKIVVISRTQSAAAKSAILANYNSLRTSLQIIMNGIVSDMDTSLKSMTEKWKTSFEEIAKSRDEILNTSSNGEYTATVSSSSGDTDNFAKGMNNAYLLTGATVFGERNGKSLVGGESGVGGEIVIGKNTLFNSISEASGMNNMIPYLEAMVNTLQGILEEEKKTKDIYIDKNKLIGTTTKGYDNQLGINKRLRAVTSV